jgi:hypothetical protein
MLLTTSGAGTSHVVTVRNTSEGVVPFYAELHGLALLGEGEVPRSSEWEGEDI